MKVTSKDSDAVYAFIFVVYIFNILYH